MKEEKDTLQDIFLKGDSVKVYFEKFMHIITDSFSNSIKEGKYDEFLSRSDKEIKVRKFYNLFNQFTTILSDLEKTLIFLKIKNHLTINDVYPELERTEDYYTYFIENYLIRINSLADVLGKILNLIYKTNIDKPNLYLFRKKIQSEFPELNEMIIALSNKIKVSKDKRHEKLHEGTTEFEYLKNIVFWNEFHKLVKEDVPEILREQTQVKINEMSEIIENEIIELIVICRNIMNISSSKMINYLEEN